MARPVFYVCTPAGPRNAKALPCLFGEALLNSYRSEGYEVGRFKIEKGKLMKFLTGVSALKGIRFRDYEPE